MASYLVTYDLNKETNRPNILADIKSTDWAQLSESSYAISTSETVEAVFNRLSKHLDGNDNLYVIALKRPYFGQGADEVHKWLTDHLDF